MRMKCLRSVEPERGVYGGDTGSSLRNGRGTLLEDGMNEEDDGFAFRRGWQDPGEHSPRLGTPGLNDGRPLAFKTMKSVYHATINRDPFSIDHGITDSLAHCRTGSLTHCRTVALSHWLTVALSHCRTVALSHCRTGSLSHWLTVALAHWLTDSLTHWLACLLTGRRFSFWRWCWRLRLFFGGRRGRRLFRLRLFWRRLRPGGR